MKKFSTSVHAKIELSKWTDKAIKTSVPTRWWSELDVVQRLFDIIQEDGEAFLKVAVDMDWNIDDELQANYIDVEFSQDEVLLMQKYLEFFSEFKKKSDLMGGELYSNIQMVYPATKELYIHINNFKEDPMIGLFAQHFQEKFAEYFDFIVDKHYVGERYTYQPLYLAACYLSPIYWNFLTMEEKEQAKKFLMEELRKIDVPPSRPRVIVPLQNLNLPMFGNISRMLENSMSMIS